MRTLFYTFAAALLQLTACASNDGTTELAQTTANAGNAPLSEKTIEYLDVDAPLDTVIRTEAEWRKLLTSEEYYVLREEGTERPFDNEYNSNKAAGLYYCAACGNPMFSSETKFESGTGWPSFYAPISKKRVKEVQDRSMGMVRTEVECARCGSHIGHVFPDGPEPTGLRYCLNSVALDFKKK